MAVANRIEARFFRPPTDLEGCFTTFYRLTVELEESECLVDCLQPEWGNLRIFSYNPPNCRISDNSSITGTHFVATGPSSQPGHFELGSTRMWGVGLFPLGWARFIGAPASEVANQVVDGHQHGHFSHFSEFTQTLFEDEPNDAKEFDKIIAVFRQHDRDVPQAGMITKTHAALVDPDINSVSEMAEQVGVSNRTLERLCRRHFGFAPKLLLRRQRFMRSLGAFMMGDEKSWSQVIDKLYHDQAQFVREFKSFMNMSPTEYAAMDHPVLKSFMRERQRQWGSPAQTLDLP
ncbi:MAG: helix-turn-helix domain-containing protein [Sphingomonadaceae bacterium]